MDGAGGRGANLTHPKLKRAADDAALMELIRNGIPGTSMDGAWQLSDAELTRLVAYVRSLGQTAPVHLPGDPLHGKQLYAENGCAGCHITSGEGRAIGPELTAIGAQRSAAYLRQALLQPGAVVPEEFASVVIKQRDGSEIQGIRVNEDTFTIQVRDLRGAYQSYRKANLVSIERPAGVSAMPAYATLAPAHLDDLIAYLAELRGEQ